MKAQIKVDGVTYKIYTEGFVYRDLLDFLTDQVKNDNTPLVVLSVEQDGITRELIMTKKKFDTCLIEVFDVME